MATSTKEKKTSRRARLWEGESMGPVDYVCYDKKQQYQCLCYREVKMTGDLLTLWHTTQPKVH